MSTQRANPEAVKIDPVPSTDSSAGSDPNWWTFDQEAPLTVAAPSTIDDRAMLTYFSPDGFPESEMLWPPPDYEAPLTVGSANPPRGKLLPL